MADPAWGAGAAALANDDLAHMLYDFSDASEPLSTLQRHRLLRSQLSEHNRSLRHSLSTIGWPFNDTCRMMPLLTPCDDAVSMRVDTNAFATVSDDWCRWHQGAISEHERDLGMQQRNQQHREMQSWQQEQVQRQQVQAQRRVERILQPRYSIGCPGEFDPRAWTKELYTVRALAPSFSNSGELNTVMQQPGQLYNARIECSEQLPDRPTTARIPTHSYMSDYSELLWSGVVMDRNDGVFALQQDPQIVPAHLQAPNFENFALYRQESRNVRLVAAPEPERAKVSQMQTLQRCSQQELLQPQSYDPAEWNQRSRQGNVSRLNLDDAFLDGIMEHFTSTPAVGNYTTVDASAGLNDIFDEAQQKKADLNVNSVQCRIQAGEEVEIKGQINARFRPPLAPSRATVVPGISLARQAVRLVTMRDILNYEDGSSMVNSSTTRPCGSKQKPIRPWRTVLSNKTSANRHKMSRKQSVRNCQHQPTNQPAGALLPGQSANDETATAFILKTARQCTPMHIAFLESRAARASEQAACIANTRPLKKVLASSTPRLQTLQPAPVMQLSTERAPNIAAYEGSDLGNSTIAVASTDVCNSSTTYPSIQQHTGTLPHDTAVLERAVQLSNLSHSSTPESKQKTDEPNTLPMGQTNVNRVCDSVMYKTFEQHRRQQSSLEVSVSLKAANNDQSPIKLDVVENKTNAKIPKKINRAKRPLARVIPLTAGDQEQQVHETLPSADVVFTGTRSIAATAVGPATVTYTPVVSELSRMENRTVVIFCKRDFMRYQAVKIWRKYQEQLKKREEWREVRVAGKRTRYLNSRYDGGIRRAKRKAYSVGQTTQKSIEESGNLQL